MLYPKRKSPKTPTEKMVNVNTEYLMDICERKGFDLEEASLAMGYNRVYLYTAIYDGRMSKEHLDFMSKILHFPYKDALDNHKKSDDDLYDLLDD